MSIDVSKIRADFPILRQTANGHPLVYLDNAASSQKPERVIAAIDNYYRTMHSNIHRGVHRLSTIATEAYEQAREKVRALIHAKYPEEVIFTRGTTESINLLASTMGKQWVKKGDEVIISELEHHSNIVPWQLMCEERGAVLKVIPVNEQGDVDMEAFDKLLNSKTKVVSISHVSNTLGTVLPIETIIKKAHVQNALVVIDGAQAISHIKTDVQLLDCDFYCFSGHKMYGPTGVGILYGKKEYLNQLPPYHGGGNMINKVTFEKTTYNDLPHKFEAGTPNIAGGIVLGEAVDYLLSTGYDNICEYEDELMDYAISKLKQVKTLKFIGTPIKRAAVISFLLGDIHALDTGTILDQMGIAVRTGHHCTQPLMAKYGITGTVRASFAFYNTKEEIDKLAIGLEKVKEILG